VLYILVDIVPIPTSSKLQKRCSVPHSLNVQFDLTDCITLSEVWPVCDSLSSAFRIKWIQMLSSLIPISLLAKFSITCKLFI
jgi:hypothetical protein